MFTILISKTISYICVRFVRRFSWCCVAATIFFDYLIVCFLWTISLDTSEAASNYLNVHCVVFSIVDFVPFRLVRYRLYIFSRRLRPAWARFRCTAPGRQLFTSGRVQHKGRNQVAANDTTDFAGNSVRNIVKGLSLRPARGRGGERKK